MDEIGFSSTSEERMGIHKAVQLVKTDDNGVEIRVCYYTRRKKMDGSEWWAFSPRPLAFGPEEAKVVADGIMKLANRYLKIKSVIEMDMKRK